MAANENLISTEEIEVRARAIDFVTSFARNWQHLLDIMRITRPIRKANGTMLTSKYATGTLESGEVAEGDLIPRSKYEVKEKDYEKIKVEKYSKEVSIEAVMEYGYDVAVGMTDEEMMVDLQEKVSGKFYTRLKSGTLKFKERTFQMAFAMAIGSVKSEFKRMHRSVTAIAAFVNTLDLYAYLGDANITVQTAFGLSYIENFLGADIVFLSDEIDRNQVIATPLNNIVNYYVDPGDSEFARMGLKYETDGVTNLVGFAAKGDYDRATGVSYAIMGLTLFAEYENAIAIVTIDKTAADKDTKSAGVTEGSLSGE